MRPESDAAREEFRRAEIGVRHWFGLPLSPQDYEWVKERFEREAPGRHVIDLGTEAAARRDLLGH